MLRYYMLISYNCSPFQFDPDLTFRENIEENKEGKDNA